MLKLLLSVTIGIVALLTTAAAYSWWQSGRIAARFPPAGLFVEVSGIRIHFTDTKPQGPPKATILLIHGAGGNEREMRAALGPQLVARQFRVISIDRPGLGWSERPSGSEAANPAGQASLIRMALEKRGVNQVLAVAHSLGGAIGMQLALDHSSFARGAVLISPTTHPWPGGIAAYYRLAASSAGDLFNYTLALPLGQIMLKPALGSVFTPQNPPPDYATRTSIALTLRPRIFAANARDVSGLFDFVTAQAPRYKTIKIPLAIVSGSADTIVYTHIHSRSTAREVPGATLNVLPGVGHAPHWVQPEAVLSAIEDVHLRTQARQVQSAR